MANVVSVSDGTTTISLCADGCLLTYYVPTPGNYDASGGAQTVSESVEFVIIDDTPALVQAKYQAINRLLAQAVERGGRTSHTAYLQLKVTDESDTWRSEIVAFRMALESDFAASFAETVLGVRLMLTRLAYWETVDESDAGTVHVVNGDGVVDELGFWIGPGGPITYEGSVSLGEGDNARNAGSWQTIDGVLPTPAHLTITNESGGAITLKRALVANDVYAEFTGAEHLIQSAAAASWTDSSAHSTARWVLALTDTQIEKAQAAGGLRLLAVFTSISAGVYVRATLNHVVTGPTYTEAWRGPEVLTTSTRKVYDLGFFSLPPQVGSGFSDLSLILTVYAEATGSGTLDFVQFCPGLDLVVLEGVGLSWANAETLDWYGDERYGYMSDYHASISASGRLMLEPARTNRVMVLVEGSSGVDSTAKLIVGVKYRPRRATI